MKSEEKQNARERQIKALIKIDDNYGIAVEPIDYTLRRIVRSAKTGSTTLTTVGAYSSVQKCLKAYIRELMHDALESDQDITIEEAIRRIETVVGRVYCIIEDAFPEYTVTEK